MKRGRASVLDAVARIREALVASGIRDAALEAGPPAASGDAIATWISPFDVNHPFGDTRVLHRGGRHPWQ